MKAAFQVKNILDITDPKSDDRDAALDAFQDSLAGVSPDDLPITVYDQQARSKVTRPGRALFFSDGSVLLIIMDEDGGGDASAVDTMTPEGLISLAQALKETEAGPALQDLISALFDKAEFDEYVEVESGRLERI